MSEKTFKYKWILEVMIILLLAAYAFIFNSVNARVSNVEGKVEQLNPTLLKIQTDIAGIRTDIQWLREKK